MLREIHVWFSTNLKGATSKNSSTVESRSEPEDRQPNTLKEVIFQLFLDSGREDSPQLICKRASLYPKWRLKISAEGARNLFICRCTEGTHEARDSSHEARDSSHNARVEAYTCECA
jgi:hypothetical protein